MKNLMIVMGLAVVFGALGFAGTAEVARRVAVGAAAGIALAVAAERRRARRHRI